MNKLLLVLILDFVLTVLAASSYNTQKPTDAPQSPTRLTAK